MVFSDCPVTRWTLVRSRVWVDVTAFGQAFYCNVDVELGYLVNLEPK